MQLRFEKQSRRERLQKKERKRWRRRFFKRIRHRLTKQRRRGLTVLAVLTAGYLLLIQKENQTIWSVKEEYHAELSLPFQKQKREVFRVVFRLKTGELLFFHETATLDSALEEEGENQGSTAPVDS